VKEGHIYIDGIISSDYHLVVKRQIDALGDIDKIIVHIQSPGGSVYAGYNTYHVLKSSGKKIEAIIEGECQSIATFIMLAADKVVARNPSIIMIHNPYTELSGDANAMENEASELRKIEATMIEAYRSKTNLPEDQLKQMMAKQTVMTATEAKGFGFVDEVLETLRAVAISKHKIKMDKNIFDNLSSRISAVMQEVFGSPKAMDMPLKDGSVLSVEGEDAANIVGSPATIAGAPAPDGDYELADGSIVVVAGGIVSEVKPAMSAEERIQKENAALKAEIEAMKTEKAQAEAAATQAAQVATTEAVAKNNKVMLMMAELKNEVEAMKKKTVGNPSPVNVAPVLTVKDESKVDDLTKDFLSEYLPHLLIK